jgi:hypothetical protein
MKPIPGSIFTRVHRSECQTSADSHHRCQQQTKYHLFHFIPSPIEAATSFALNFTAETLSMTIDEINTGGSTNAQNQQKEKTVFQHDVIYWLREKESAMQSRPIPGLGGPYPAVSSDASYRSCQAGMPHLLPIHKN